MLEIVFAKVSAMDINSRLDLTAIFCDVDDWLFVTLYAKSTYKMPRQHTSNPKIPKVSKAIASSFY